MTLSLIYWVILLIWLAIGLYGVANAPDAVPFQQRLSPGGIILFLLFLILGWAQLGAPIK